ncbi:MAG TPA: hypothetical protein VGH37_16655 [Candidatus Acidoferrum sp.]|jgi:hypothetical protein
MSINKAQTQDAIKQAAYMEVESIPDLTPEQRAHLREMVTGAVCKQIGRAPNVQGLAKLVRSFNGNRPTPDTYELNGKQI